MKTEKIDTVGRFARRAFNRLIATSVALAVLLSASATPVSSYAGDINQTEDIHKCKTTSAELQPKSSGIVEVVTGTTATTVTTTGAFTLTIPTTTFTTTTVSAKTTAIVTSTTTSTTTTTTTTTSTSTVTTVGTTTTTTVEEISASSYSEDTNAIEDEESEEEVEEAITDSEDDSETEDFEDSYSDEQTENTYSIVVSDADYILLCNAVANEAGSNWIATADKAKVVEVILNRANSSGSSIYAVLTARGQFSGCWGYVNLGTFSSYVSDDVRAAVSGYLNGEYPNHGYTRFYGDGYQNHFS